MKRNFIKFTGIALVSALALSACKKEAVKEEPLLAALLSSVVKAAASGNCAISVNLAGLYYGTVEQLSINGALAAIPAVQTASAAFIAHYNSVNGTSITIATLNAEPYNKKYDTFYTDKDTWNATTRATLVNTVANDATVNGAVASLATLKSIRGTGLLACGRIPRSSCSLSGLGTTDRATDIKNQASVADTLLNNQACKKSSTTVINTIKDTIFRGLPTDTTATTADGVVYVNYAANATTLAFSSSDTNAATGLGNYTHQQGNTILASNAYPKVGALVTLGFGQLMPAKAKTGDTATAYSLSASESVKGTNIAFTTVDSCESLGLGNTGFVPTATTYLTSTKEIVYAFSTNGTAAAAYASAIGANLTASGKPAAGVASTTAADIQKVNDAYACNASLRSATSLPLAIGGGKLDVIQAVSGDGNSSALLTTCVYGQTTALRATAAAVVSAADDSGLPAALANITHCPATASTGAAKFADTGIETLSNFPNN
ncbi:hypothetical protein [Leptospira sp. 'Mane']|uniref:hypothetical protein n=1 Tax=Leptospira sp. 'Mane' TaxID=3387407 RepID=UPI00398BA052